MASSKSNDGDNGDPHLLPAESPTTPSPVPESAKPKRSITPRGPIFSNLNDAHRNITSRLAPTNPFRKPAGEDQSGKEDIPLQEFSSPVLPYRHEDHVIVGELRRNFSDFVSPNPSQLVASRCLTDRRSIMKPWDSTLSTKDDSSNTMTAPESRGFEDTQDPKATDHVDKITKSQQPDASDSTVCRILDHYTTADDGHTPSSASNWKSASDQENTSQACTLKLPLRSVTRLAFHDIGSCGSLESCNEAKQTQTAKVIPGTGNLTKPVVVGLRDESISERSHISYIAPPGPLPTTCGLDSKQSRKTGWVKGGEVDQGVKRPLAQSLMPQPLRIPSNREIQESDEAFLTRCSSHNDTTSSVWPVGGVELTESNDDPFVYDNARYRHMQQLGKEREISRALKCMSGRERDTEASVVSMATSPEKLQAYSPKKPKGDPSSPERDAYVDGSFFDPVAFRALHGDTGDVRVVIGRGPEGIGGQESRQPSIRPIGLSTDMNAGQNGRSAREPTEGDWVTEATSEIDLGMAILGGHFPKPTIKETGSSIADYSDCEIEHIHHFPSRLGSREPIIQHPSGESETNSYELHNLKGTNQTVLLHRPQFPRFNGFGQNSARFGVHGPKRGGFQNGVTNPFRRDYRRADASSYFSFKPGREASSKYEFRDSSSTCGPATGSNQAVCGTKATLPHSMSPLNTAKLQASRGDPFVDGESIRLPKTRANNNNPTRGHSRRPVAVNLPRHTGQLPEQDLVEAQAPVPMTPRDTGNSLTTASSKFSFKLLDLSEAQVLQKQQRESGESDETEDSTVRYHRAHSNSASNKPNFTQPSPAYLRSPSQIKKASMLSSHFMAPLWRGSGPRNVSNATVSHIQLGDYTEPTITPQNRMLPLDKRVRAVRSGRMLRNGLQQDVESIQGSEEYFVSYKAHSRINVFFYGMLGLSIFPFFALLALNGNFDGLLSWLTDGEVSQMTKKQRKIMKIVFVVECIILTSLVAGVVAYYVTVSKMH